MKLFEGIDHGSMYPAFFYKQQIQELKDEIDSDSRRLERGEVPYEQTWRVKNELNKKKEKLYQVERTRPKLTVGEEKRLQTIFKILSDAISDAMPTHTEVEKGLVHPHEEVKRMKQPCVPITGAEAEIAELAKLCRIKVDKRSKKISRDDASRIWKIACALLDKAEYPNVEVLRKQDRKNTLVN